MKGLTAKQIEQLKLVDAWSWAYFNKLNIMGGIFKWKGYEYLAEPLKSMAQKRCVRKATQGGFTNNEVIRALHRCKHNYYKQGVMYLFPTRNDVTDFSNSRFKPMMANNYDLIGSSIKDTDQSNLKAVGNAFLYFRGTRMTHDIGGRKTALQLKGIPCDEVVFDEFDEMPKEAESFAINRMGNSPYKNECYLANPTVDDWGIDLKYKNSDERIWMIRCGKCGKETCLELEFPNCLKKKGGQYSARGIVIRLAEHDVVYRACVHCGGELDPGRGRWIAQYPDREMAGWWYSHLMSIRSDMTQLMREFEDPLTDLGNFHNLRLGMAYTAAENRLSENDVFKCCSSDIMAVRHDGPCGMGVDVGKDLHITIGIRRGDKAIKVVKIVRLTSFEDAMDLAKRFSVKSAVFDLYPETRKVREFAADAPFPVYGCDYQEKQRSVVRWDEGSQTVVAGRTELLDATHALCVIVGRLELPRVDDEVKEFAFEMCQTAKVLEEDKMGGTAYRYKKLGADHYRHALNYLYLACDRLPIYSGRAGGAFVTKKRAYAY